MRADVPDITPPMRVPAGRDLVEDSRQRVADEYRDAVPPTVEPLDVDTMQFIKEPTALDMAVYHVHKFGRTTALIARLTPSVFTFLQGITMRNARTTITAIIGALAAILSHFGIRRTDRVV